MLKKAKRASRRKTITLDRREAAEFRVALLAFIDKIEELRGELVNVMKASAPARPGAAGGAR